MGEQRNWCRVTYTTQYEVKTKPREKTIIKNRSKTSIFHIYLQTFLAIQYSKIEIMFFLKIKLNTVSFFFSKFLLFLIPMNTEYIPIILYYNICILYSTSHTIFISTYNILCIILYNIRICVYEWHMMIVTIKNKIKLIIHIKLTT